MTSDGRPNVRSLPSLKEVAAAAGVSPSTVSNVFVGRIAVRPVTRRRVLQAAERLGYRPDGLAQALRTGRARAIGLCIPFVTNPTMAAIIHGVAHEAYERGYALTICAPENNRERERIHLDVMARQRVAAVITLAASDDATPYLALQRGGAPVIFVDRRPPGIAAALITPDHGAGTAAAAHHLLVSGRRRIALLTGPREIGSSVVRIDGFGDAHAAAGVPVDPRLISSGPRTEADAEQAVAALLDGPSRPDAIVAGNATLTLGALACLRDRGVAIPEEIALVGAGDVAWARLVDPPLTMIEVDAGALGRAAAVRAFERIEEVAGAGPPPADVVLPAPLVVRSSA
jgi:LacI family transcriptional regulator